MQATPRTSELCHGWTKKGELGFEASSAWRRTGGQASHSVGRQGAWMLLRRQDPFLRLMKIKYQKLLEIEKRARLLSGDEHHLRKTALRKAQISPVSGTNAFLMCAFRSADFLTWCLSPERNLARNLFLSISNSSCLILLSGLEKSAAIRPFATKKSRLASEKILLADSLATESCRLVDRLATKFFSKWTTPMRTERDRARSLADVFVGPRCKGVGRSGPSIVFANKPTPGV